MDLIYLDPPFNTNASYNVFFAEQDGARAAAQIKAFEDTWRWDQASVRLSRRIVQARGPDPTAMQAFRQFLGDSNMLAYLAMMAPRLLELSRVLKPTGVSTFIATRRQAITLRCSWTPCSAPDRFVNEVIWKTTHST